MRAQGRKQELMTSYAIDPVQLSQNLIQCRSVTPADDGALDIVAQTLQSHGFSIERLRFEGRGSYPVDNIFATIGQGTPHLCFMGHTDVVPPGDIAAWTHDPFRGETIDGILYGRGAADMKTGVASSISAAIEFVRTEPLCGTISFLITGDEEADSINGSQRVIEWLKDQNKLPNDAVVCEPSNPEIMGSMMRVGRRGSFHGDLIVRGKQGHSAYPERFINPIDRLITLTSNLISYEWDNGTDKMPRTHLAMTSIDVGNTTRNTVPSEATAKFNIRFNSLWTSETLTKKLHDILGTHNIPYELTTTCNAESFITESPHLIQCMQNAIHDVSGTKAVLDTGGGTSDARFIAPYCPVIEYGVITKTNHQVDEHMKVEDIYTATQTYISFLKYYFGLRKS